MDFINYPTYSIEIVRLLSRHVATGVRRGAVAPPHPHKICPRPTQKKFQSGLKYNVNMPVSPIKQKHQYFFEEYYFH